MEIKDSRVFDIIEQSQVGETRRQLLTYCQDSGLDENPCDKISIASQELCTNLLKYSHGGGRIIAQTIKVNDVCGLDLYCIDSGIGMDVEECLIDGFSSGGTLGTGLGSIKRLSDEFDIQSVNQAGTVVHARFWNNQSAIRSSFSWGALSVPKEGEMICGDKWSLHVGDNHAYSIIIDGLGHGIEASEAASLAIKRFGQNLDLPPSAMMKLLHMSLRGSRGAVGAVAKIDKKLGQVVFCGLGNIEGQIHTGDQTKRLVSMNGTLGYEGRKFNEFTVPWLPQSTMIVHTDGLSIKTLNGLENIDDKSAALVAGWLYKTHSKRIDDATIVVLKGSEER